MAATQAS